MLLRVCVSANLWVGVCLFSVSYPRRLFDHRLSFRKHARFTLALWGYTQTPAAHLLRQALTLSLDHLPATLQQSACKALQTLAAFCCELAGVQVILDPSHAFGELRHRLVDTRARKLRVQEAPDVRDQGLVGIDVTQLSLRVL